MPFSLLFCKLFRNTVLRRTDYYVKFYYAWFSYMIAQSVFLANCYTRTNCLVSDALFAPYGFEALKACPDFDRR